MDLMLHVPSGSTSQLELETLRRWLRVIYRDVYGCPADDPRIDRMLEGAPALLPLL